jgi:hypothetical protein
LIPVEKKLSPGIEINAPGIFIWACYLMINWRLCKIQGFHFCRFSPVVESNPKIQGFKRSSQSEESKIAG